MLILCQINNRAVLTNRLPENFQAAAPYYSSKKTAQGVEAKRSLSSK